MTLYETPIVVNKAQRNVMLEQFPELKKNNSHEKHQTHIGLGMSSTLGRMSYLSRGASGSGGGLIRGGSLKHGNFSMSHSGRF